MAPDLVGALLVVDAGTSTEVRARIVEVEAYMGAEDAASHAHRGPTPRAGIMFGSPGHLYVYLSYGIHRCANIVCSPEGTASAVLLRAASVEVGEALVRARRGDAPAERLLSGPGNLCSGLGISADDNGLDIVRGRRVTVMIDQPSPPIATGPRVGITRAADLRLRFWADAHPALSARPGRRVHKKGTGTSAGPSNMPL